MPRPEQVIAVFTHNDFLQALFSHAPVALAPGSEALRQLRFSTGDTHAVELFVAEGVSPSAPFGDAPDE